jgi:hypothetical protein
MILTTHPSQIPLGRQEHYRYREGIVMQTRGEQWVCDYLKHLGYEVKRPGGAGADFTVVKDGIPCFVCEVKDLEGTGVEGCVNDPALNRVTAAIEHAHRQLTARNPDHHLLNVLVLFNSDPDSEIKDLDGVMTGYFYSTEGARAPIYEKFSEGRIKDLKCEIDLYIWCQVDAGHHLYYRIVDGPHQEAVIRLFDFPRDKIGPIRTSPGRIT